MGLIIDKKKKISIIADEVHIMGLSKGKPYSVTTFLVKNADGKTIDILRCDLEDKEHDLFWKRFNSGKSVYEMVVDKYDLPIVVDDDVEVEFLNHPHKVIENSFIKHVKELQQNHIQRIQAMYRKYFYIVNCISLFVVGAIFYKISRH